MSETPVLCLLPCVPSLETVWKERRDFYVFPSQLNHCVLHKTTFTRPGKESKTDTPSAPMDKVCREKGCCPLAKPSCSRILPGSEVGPSTFPCWNQIRREIGTNGASTECSPKGGIALLPPSLCRALTAAATKAAVAHCRQGHPAPACQAPSCHHTATKEHLGTNTWDRGELHVPGDQRA